MNDSPDSRPPSAGARAPDDSDRPAKGAGSETAVWRRAIGTGPHSVTFAGSEQTQRIEALSLTALVEDAKSVGRPHALPLGAVIESFVKAAMVLERAHERLQMHGGIRPERMLIGRYGEVVLTDWGDRSSPDMTPWVAPESTLGAKPGPEDDLHALCACLSFALTLQPPGSPGDADADALPASARPILAIARRGLVADPKLRFHAAAELVAALGLALPPGSSIGRDGSLEHKPRSRAVLAVVGLCLVAAAIVGWRVWLRPAKQMLEQASPPIVSENFSDDTWRMRWKARGEQNQFFREGDALVNRGDQAVLILNRLLAPPVIIEFTGEIPRGSLPSDLSVIWGEGNLRDDSWKWPAAGTLPDKGRFFLLQNASFDNSWNGICRYGPEFSNISYQIAPLEVGRSYRIRVEVQPRSISLWRDGRLVGTCDEDVAMRAGSIAILLGHPGKRVRDVQVWNPPLTEADPFAVGDSFLAIGANTAAADVFSTIIQTNPGTHLSEEARYHLGIALLAAGNTAGAAEVFASITDPSLQGKARIRNLMRMVKAGEHDRALATIEEVWTTYPWLRSTVTAQFSAVLEKVVWDPRFTDYVNLRERLFPDDDTTGLATANFLLWTQDYRRVVDHYSRFNRPYVKSLLALGENAMAERSAVDYESRSAAALQLGKLAGIPPADTYGLLALCLQGKIDEAKADFPGKILPLLYAGDYAAAAACSGPDDQVAAARKRMQPQTPILQFTEADWADLRKLVVERDKRRSINQCAEAVLRGCIQGLPAEEQQRLRESMTGLKVKLDQTGVWFPRYLLLPLLDAFAGHPEALKAALADAERSQRDRFSQRFWFFARRVQGTISDQEFLAQPVAIEAPAWMALADAMAAELAGDRGLAAQRWQVLADMPRHRRCFDRALGSEEIELLIAWRCATLHAPPQP